MRPPSQADEAAWNRHNQAGITAYRQGNYPEAVRQLEAALAEAHGFGEGDSGLGATLNNLAAVYASQARCSEAERLGRRALSISEKALAPEHPDIGRAEALRRSMLAMMNDEAKADFAHPMFWTPFVVVGEGGRYAARWPR